MSLLIDVIVIAAFALALFSGVKKGFVRSVMFSLIAVLSVLGAIKFTPEMSEYLNDKFIEKPVVKLVYNSIDDLLSDEVDIDTLIDQKPSPFLKMLDRFGVTYEDVLDALQLVPDEEGEDKVQSISEYIAEPISMSISKGVAFVVLFIALFIILFIIGIIISIAVKLPVLKAADKLLGSVLGAISGLLIAWGLSLAIYHLVPNISVLYKGVLPENIIENSIIVKFLGEFDPMNLFK